MSTEESTFSGDWLALREPVDHRSRSAELVRELGAWLGRRGAAKPMVVDLGAGSGSNFRYLSARLLQPVTWRLLDHDAALLAAVHGGRAPSGVTTRVCDLGADALAGCVAGAAVVTASALLDLTSAHWIDALCAACVRQGAALLVALTIDGRVAFDPAEALDGVVFSAVARDQQRDKGLGIALGAGAASALVRALARHGYRVTQRGSDWRLDRREGALARALIDGWAEAASRQSPGRTAHFAAWAARRSAAVAAGSAKLLVGHRDVLGLPP